MPVAHGPMLVHVSTPETKVLSSRLSSAIQWVQSMDNLKCYQGYRTISFGLPRKTLSKTLYPKAKETWLQLGKIYNVQNSLIMPFKSRFLDLTELTPKVERPNSTKESGKKFTNVLKSASSRWSPLSPCCLCRANNANDVLADHDYLISSISQSMCWVHSSRQDKTYPHYCVITACLKALYKAAYSIHKSGIILKSKTWHGSKSYWHIFENMQKVGIK